ncbi:MAG: Plug domain-containing protein [Gemmatimonadales bacterium]
MPGDTTKAKRPPRDTIKTPTARPYAPRFTDIGASSWHWDRDQIFSSGAFTLGDLLASVPGVTMMTTGFLLAPQVAAYYGDPGRVRIYLDGIELDALNPRNGGVPDLAMVPLWAMEDVQVERTAGELRVHLRSWSVDHTTPNTRTDVVTGTENLNLYRGFFGKRFDNGMVLQLAGQQQSSISVGGMDGDALGGLARFGWARGAWSVDATWIHQGINRNSGDRFITTAPQNGAIPPYFGSEGVSYLRIGWRDPNADGPWIQLIASTLSEAKKDTTSSLTSALAGTSVGDSTDTLRSRPQYVLAAGITRWGIRLSSTTRIRSVDGTTYFSPGVRAEYASKFLTVSAFGEHSADSTTRTDVQGRFTPFPWFNAGASVSRAAPTGAGAGPPVTATRLEVAIGVKDRWLTGGVVTRSASALAAPIELDTTLRAVPSPAANGEIVSFRGPLLLGVHLDLDAINWSVVDDYRPQTQARARLWFESSFIHRFPRNNFHVLASATYDYFSTLYAPTGATPLGQSTAGAGIISTLLEIRISTAVIFWQYRNVVGAIYSTYPGYVMPRLVNLYGVRWQFWN